MELANQSDMHLEAINGDGPELRWCIFTKGKKGPIAKIIVDTRPKKVQSADYEPTAHIVNVHVRPEYRGKKLGEHLVRLAQTAMKANGFIWMTLEAEENVEFHGKLVRLYERCGFEIYPPSDRFPLEYNGDECFRKVPMRCRLLDMNLEGPLALETPPNPATTTTTTTVPSKTADIPLSPYNTALFVQELKREALNVLGSCPLNVTVQVALEWIDQHLAPGTLEIALRTGSLIKARGHPDWMELAGYLRFIGRVQEKWTSWQSPFMIQVQDVQPHLYTEHQSDDEEDGPLPETHPILKSGPLPGELCTMSSPSRFIDPERYAQEGVDEASLTWSPNEYSFLAFTVADRCSAPHEMAQMLRYVNCTSWLDGDEFNYLESYGESDLKKLACEFRNALRDADHLEMLNARQVEEHRLRLNELVDKYASDVRMM